MAPDKVREDGRGGLDGGGGLGMRRRLSPSEITLEVAVVLSCLPLGALACRLLGSPHITYDSDKDLMTLIGSSYPHLTNEEAEAGS